MLPFGMLIMLTLRDHKSFLFLLIRYFQDFQQRPRYFWYEHRTETISETFSS